MTENTFVNHKPCQPNIIYGKEGTFAHFWFKVNVDQNKLFFVREIIGLFDIIKGLLGTISGLSALYGIIAWKVLYPRYQDSIAKKIIYKRKCHELRDFALEQGGFHLVV